MRPWPFAIIVQIGSCGRRFHLSPLNLGLNKSSLHESSIAFVSPSVGRLLSFHKPLTLELPSSYNILKYFECASIGWLSISVGCWFESVHSMRAHRVSRCVSRCVSDFVRSPSFCCTLPPLSPTVSPTLSRTLLPICLPACGHLVSQLVSQHFSP